MFPEKAKREGDEGRICVLSLQDVESGCARCQPEVAGGPPRGAADISAPGWVGGGEGQEGAFAIDASSSLSLSLSFSSS